MADLPLNEAEVKLLLEGEPDVVAALDPATYSSAIADVKGWIQSGKIPDAAAMTTEQKTALKEFVNSNGVLLRYAADPYMGDVVWYYRYEIVAKGLADLLSAHLGESVAFQKPTGV